MNIRKTRLYDANIEDVWQAITDEKKLTEWFMPARFKAEPGYQFEFQDQPQGKWDGRLWGEVNEVIEPHRLCYSWIGNQMNNKTLVEWTLKKTHQGTKVTLEHSGFKGFNDSLIGFFHRFGWRKYFSGLDKFLL
ncbi:MAG: SRPBCC domain-containing protein [Pseudomonadales bacterium]|nr:SRPBCC domain-containing protein [Pseudomonadales bacterium]